MMAVLAGLADIHSMAVVVAARLAHLGTEVMVHMVVVVAMVEVLPVQELQAVTMPQELAVGVTADVEQQVVVVVLIKQPPLREA
tara:strand:+ start:5617 stop:5868 length:252 start_codon:yes stop_codon:yes gene_type:complete